VANQKPYEILTGVGTLYIAALGATVPAITATPSTFWTSVGDTEGGVKLTIDQKITAFSSDQKTAPVKAIRTEESGMVETKLVNATLETLALLNSQTVSSATSFKSIGLYRGATVTPFAALYRGDSPYGPFPRQYAIPAGYFDGPIEIEHTKDGNVQVPLQFVLLADPNAGTFSASFFGFITDQTS
jgi:hypothetical protein